ncbi:MAG: stage V sporulation protein AA [Natronincolaceae bacterium]|jgi:stage V sporulation protein AA|nr:stage V sporulation protein AA [Bacillota bacterium]NLK91228.1 stage V sporulation protein AB [Clostridiales bacterium]
MNMDRQVFLSLKEKAILRSRRPVLLRDLANISAEEEIKRDLEKLVYPINIEEEDNISISAISVISFIKKNVHDIDLVVVGETDVLVSFVNEEINKDKYRIVRVILVCFLLFIGSITAIINFHSDVDMKQAHKAIYRVITGIETDKLLLIQIPYSLGIGAGMSVFFNHVFNKKINKEPTPLEMEIHTYQQGVDKYIKNNSVKG